MPVSSGHRGTFRWWGARYNSEVESDVQTPHKPIFNNLPQAFTKNDVYAQCIKSGIKTPIRQIIYLWCKQGYIKKTDDGGYEKVLKK